MEHRAVRSLCRQLVAIGVLNETPTGHSEIFEVSNASFGSPLRTLIAEQAPN